MKNYIFEFPSVGAGRLRPRIADFLPKPVTNLPRQNVNKKKKP